MDPEKILALLTASVGVVSELVPLAQQVRSQLSETDQAALDATLAQLAQARQAAVTQAEADLTA